MKIPLAKLKAILLYFATNTDQAFLGKVKLMKLLYFADFTHVKKHGAPITYDTYVNLEHGPIPSFIKNLVDNLADDPDSSMLADTLYIQKPPDYDMYRIHPKRKFTDNDRYYLSETELAILQQVVDRFGNVNTKIIEDASHKEAPWKETRELEEIPYTLASRDPDSLVTEEEINLLHEITS